MISFKVFMSFVDEKGDASRVPSKECYNTWVLTRRSPPKQPEESFRRVLTAHVCGVDGRRPFAPHIEQSLLRILRKKEVWECFRGTGVSIGIRGFRNLGYHEARIKSGITLSPEEKAPLRQRSRKRQVEFEASPKKIKAAKNEDSGDLAKLIAMQQVQIQQQIEQMRQTQMQLLHAQMYANKPAYPPQFPVTSHPMGPAMESEVQTSKTVVPVMPPAHYQLCPVSVQVGTAPNHYQYQYAPNQRIYQS